MAKLCLLLSMALLSLAQVPETASSAPPPDTPYEAEWKARIAEGGRLYQDGRVAEASRAFQKAVGCARHFGALDPRFSTTLHALAFLYREQGKYQEAAQLYQRVIRLREKMGPAAKAALAQSIDELIGTYMEARNFRSARTLIEQRLPEMERSAREWKDRVALLDMRATLALTEHSYNNAESLFRQAMALRMEHLPAGDQGIAIASMNLSEALASARRYQEALDADLRALAILDRLDATSSTLLIRVLDHAAMLSVKLRRPAVAESYYQRALAAARESLGPDHSLVGLIMLSYSAVLRSLGRNAEAQIMTAEAQGILRRSREAVNVAEITAAR
jgi:tetratricopeptide (TPR) repeat protein